MTPLQEQKGVTLVLIVFVMASILLAVLLPPLLSKQTRTANHSSQSLKVVKQHLLAYALRVHLQESTRVDKYHQVRLGELPCPDFNNDAKLPTGDYGLGGACRSHVGWLPWRTLRMNPRRITPSMPIWYAVDTAFSNRVVYGSVPIGGINEPVLNASTTPTLMLNGQPMAAIAFFTGEPMPSQTNRQQTNANTAQIQFLEEENADANDLAFVQKPKSTGFNDVVIGITKEDILSVVEHHAALLVAKRLNEFYTQNGTYPFAANGTGACDSAAMQTLGAVPQTCTGGAYALAFPLPSSTSDKDVWLVRNGWLSSIRYTRSAADRVVLTLSTGQTVTFYQGQKEGV